MDDKKPNPFIRSSVITEDPQYLTDEQIKQLNTDSLLNSETYLTTFIELLAGSQIWDMLDNLAKIETELRRRKIQGQYKYKVKI